LIEAAALPLVTTTGNELISATGIKAGLTVLVAGAAGNVGRSAVFTAKERGATVRWLEVFAGHMPKRKNRK
jgi:NADPH:quinone reductase-like Zn-dependent oxidoreductase